MQFEPLGDVTDTTFMSDEVIRGFTGKFIGVTAVDSMSRRQVARYSAFSLTY